jgi:hypothetical protein
MKGIIPPDGHGRQRDRRRDCGLEGGWLVLIKELHEQKLGRLSSCPNITQLDFRASPENNAYTFSMVLISFFISGSKLLRISNHWEFVREAGISS